MAMIRLVPASQGGWAERANKLRMRGLVGATVPSFGRERSSAASRLMGSRHWGEPEPAKGRSQGDTTARLTHAKAGWLPACRKQIVSDFPNTEPIRSTRLAITGWVVINKASIPRLGPSTKGATG